MRKYQTCAGNGRHGKLRFGRHLLRGSSTNAPEAPDGYLRADSERQMDHDPAGNQQRILADETDPEEFDRDYHGPSECTTAGTHPYTTAALLLAFLLGDGIASLRQWFRALDWLTEQHTVVDDLLLQLLVLGADDAVALGPGQTQLEPIEVGQVATLSLGGGTFLPSGAREFFLEVEGFQSLADHLALGGVRELHPILGQMEVVHGILLTRNAS